MATEHATLLLNKQLKELTKHPVEGFSAGLVDDNNIFEWEIMIMGPRDTLYEGGFFRAIMTFPPEYPLLPPKLRFTTDIYHPNVYPDGEVCISILHPPGEDNPNDESPANIEAAKEWRNDYSSYKKKVQRITRRSAEDM